MKTISLPHPLQRGLLLAALTTFTACSSSDDGTPSTSNMDGGASGSSTSGGDSGSSASGGNSGSSASGGAPATGSGGAPSSSGAGGTSSESDAMTPPGNEDVLVGQFNVDSVAPTMADPSGHVAVIGKVYDGPNPPILVWELAMEEDGCRLFTPRVPFCEEPCGGSAACVEDDTCQPYPKAQSVGTVTVKGLKAEDGSTEFSMNPIGNGYQPPASVKLPLDALEEGSSIEVTAAGDTLDGFTLMAKGVSALEVPSEDPVLEEDEPLELRWTPPGASSTSNVYIKVDISHHGGTKGMIECETDDDGELDISAEMATGLIDLGVSGFPTVVIQRKTTGSAVIAEGRVDLVVGARIERDLEIPGLVSCNQNSDCPDGQDCQVDRRCE